MVHEGKGTGHVGSGEVRVEGECPVGGLVGAGEDLSRTALGEPDGLERQGLGQAGVRGSERRVQLDCLFQEANGFADGLTVELHQLISAPKEEVVCVEVVGSRQNGRVRFGDRGALRLEPGKQARDHGRDDLVLDGEDVVHLPLEAVGPDVIALAGVDELGGYTQAVPGSPNAALHDVGDAQACTDVTHIETLPLEGECGRACRDAKRPDASERVRQLLRDAVGEVLALGLGAHVLER